MDKIDDINDILNEIIPSDSSEISFNESTTNQSTSECAIQVFVDSSTSECSAYNITHDEYDSEATEVFLDESLPYQIYNYVYTKKTDFALMYTSFWEEFKISHPNVSPSPMELKMYFFEEVLPYFKNFEHLTSYQRKYFDVMSDFYKHFNIEILQQNDPIPGIHYYRADDNDSFLSLLDRSEVNIIGITENVNYDIHSEANIKQLFEMNESMKLWYSAFLRNVEEIQNNVLLEQDEILKRLRNYFAEGKILPSISEINEILKSMAPQHSSLSSMSLSSSSINYSRTSTRINLPSLPVTNAREELTRYFDSLGGPRRERKPKRDTKTLRKMQDNLRNPKLKELERRAKAAKNRFRKYLK